MIIEAVIIPGFKCLLLLLFLYHIVYRRVFRLYYLYWFYTRQGIPCVGLPWPVLGNLPTFLKSLSQMDHHSKTPLEDYFTRVFGLVTPPVFLDLRDPSGILVFTDPRYVDELYMAKNKFFDKADKEREVYYEWFGESIFHAKSNR